MYCTVLGWEPIRPSVTSLFVPLVEHIRTVQYSTWYDSHTVYMCIMTRVVTHECEDVSLATEYYSTSVYWYIRYWWVFMYRTVPYDYDV
jgi:hypothetical protein